MCLWNNTHSWLIPLLIENTSRLSEPCLLFKTRLAFFLIFMNFIYFLNWCNDLRYYIGVCNSNIKKSLLHLQGSSLTKFFFFINKNGVSVDFKRYFYKNTSFFCSVTQQLLWECTFTNPLLDIKLTMRKIWHQYENTINRIKNHKKKIMKTDSIPKWVAQTKNKLNLTS